VSLTDLSSNCHAIRGTDPFPKHSIVRCEDKREASVFVLNTCSIRDHAEQKVYSYVGPYAIRKQKGENIAIVVAG